MVRRAHRNGIEDFGLGLGRGPALQNVPKRSGVEPVGIGLNLYISTLSRCAHAAFHKRTYHFAMKCFEHRNDAANLHRQFPSPLSAKECMARTHRQASQSRQDLPGSRVLVQPAHESAEQKSKASLLRARLVNRVLRPRSNADPPPFLRRPPPTMLPLLEIRQPLDYRQDPARGGVLQAHREQTIVHTEYPLRRGELNTGKREQRGVGLPC